MTDSTTSEEAMATTSEEAIATTSEGDFPQIWTFCPGMPKFKERNCRKRSDVWDYMFELIMNHDCVSACSILSLALESWPSSVSAETVAGAAGGAVVCEPDPFFEECAI